MTMAAVHGVTPLHVAAIAGHPQVCTMLVAAGASVDTRTPNDTTSLHLAAHAACDVLLEEGLS